MTTRPRLRLGSHLLPGLIAVVFFGVLTFIFLGASFGDAAGFAEDAHITAAIGYALFNIGIGDVPSEGFLAAFILIALVLDAALDGAVMLAFRDDEEEGAISQVRSQFSSSDQTSTVRRDGGDEQ